MLTTACSQHSTREAIDLAKEAGADTCYTSGSGFAHLLVTRIPAQNVEQLTLYIGGDGQAFSSPARVSADPTPRQHLGLRLMLADSNAAAYIGRPCYYGAVGDIPCVPALWTTARYSPEVRDSLAEVVAILAGKYPQARIRLVGYSGGGTLALLVAAVSPRVSEVVTLAAPLDTRQWTTLHGYTPLSDSLNPAAQQTWPPGLRQLHFFGENDDNVPAAISRDFIAALQAQGLQIRTHTISDFDHNCCWLEAWPSLLQWEELQHGGQHVNKDSGPRQQIPGDPG